MSTIEGKYTNSTITAGGHINSNNRLTQHFHNYAPPPLPPILPPLPSCPLPSQQFLGRKAELLSMELFFFGGPSSNLERRVFSIMGMGGCGKSQIAFYFVHHYVLLQFTPFRVFFIDATSTLTLDASFSSIAKSMGVGSTSDDARNWLSRSVEPCFLLIDNADDPTFDLHGYLPQSSAASVLITTRLQNAGLTYGNGPHSYIDLDALHPEEAEELLANTAGIEVGNEAEAVSTLAKELYYHALAVAQAGAGIAALRLTVSQYTDQYRRLRTQLMDGVVDGVTRSALSGYPKHVATTWLLGFRELPSTSRTLLILCGHLHHTGITEEIFKKALEHYARYKPSIPLSSLEQEGFSLLSELLLSFGSPDGSWNQLAFRQCIRHVLDISLLRYDKKTDVYSIHPLVHDGLCRIARNHLAASFLLALSERVDPRDVFFLHRLAPHLEKTLLLHVDVKSSTVTDLHPDLAITFSNILFWNNDMGQAERLERHAVGRRSAVLGVEHPSTLTALHELGGTLATVGRLGEAEAIQRRVLLGQIEAIGREDPETIQSLSYLARTLFRLGQFAESEEMYREVFELRKKQLGEDHLDTYRAWQNLARSLLSLGRFEEGADMTRVILARRVQGLGDEYPDTIHSLWILSNALQSLGNLEEAAEYLQRVIHSRSRQLGEGHWDTINSMRQLATISHSLGRFHQVFDLRTRILNLQEKSRAKDDPATIWSLSEVAECLFVLGTLEETDEGAEQVIQLQEAMEKGRQVVDDMGHVFGPEDRATVWARERLEVYSQAYQDRHKLYVLRRENVGKDSGGTTKDDNAVFEPVDPSSVAGKRSRRQSNRLWNLLRQLFPIRTSSSGK